jgi:hypothetical protein
MYFGKLSKHSMSGLFEKKEIENFREAFNLSGEGFCLLADL